MFCRQLPQALKFLVIFMYVDALVCLCHCACCKLYIKYTYLCMDVYVFIRVSAKSGNSEKWVVLKEYQEKSREFG